MNQEHDNSSTPQPLGGVYIGLGGNLAFNGRSGGRLFQDVLDQLRRSGLEPIGVSSVWSSPAWPDPSTPPYSNAVAEINPGDADAHGVLKLLLDVEQKMGRVRTKAFAPRTLDLDLIDFRERVWVDEAEDGLVIPHLRAHERSFVLGPLAEIAADWRHPVLKTPVSALLAEAMTLWPAKKTGWIPGYSQAPQNGVELVASFD